MNTIKAERKSLNITASYARCLYCQAFDNESSSRLENKERENLILKQRIRNLEGVIESLKHELEEKVRKL
jgi:hypothetical protein